VWNMIAAGFMTTHEPRAIGSGQERTRPTQPTQLDTLSGEVAQGERNDLRREVPEQTQYVLIYQGERYECHIRYMSEYDEYSPVLDMVIPAVEIRCKPVPAVRVESCALVRHKDTIDACGIPMKVVGRPYDDDSGFTMVHLKGYGSLMAQGNLLPDPEPEQTV
jgi:hypothetical protein